MPKGDSWIVRFHYPQNLKFLMFPRETSSKFLCFLETCSCCPGFTFMWRNDEGTLSFDGSNLKFEDSRGWIMNMIWRLVKDLDLPEFWPYGCLKVPKIENEASSTVRGSVIWQTFYLMGEKQPFLLCYFKVHVFYRVSHLKLT